MAAEYYIRGLAEFKAALRQIDNDLGGELRKGLNEVAQVVVDAARQDVPRRSGRAQASMKAGSTQNAAQIKVGGTAAPYYPWLDFGGAVGRNKSVTRPFIQKGRYVYPAAEAQHDAIVNKLEDVIDGLTRKAGF
jgi:phage gpG-like protein